MWFSSSFRRVVWEAFAFLNLWPSVEIVDWEGELSLGHSLLYSTYSSYVVHVCIVGMVSPSGNHMAKSRPKFYSWGTHEYSFFYVVSRDIQNFYPGNFKQGHAPSMYLRKKKIAFQQLLRIQRLYTKRARHARRVYTEMFMIERLITSRTQGKVSSTRPVRMITFMSWYEQRGFSIIYCCFFMNIRPF